MLRDLLFRKRPHPPPSGLARRLAESAQPLGALGPSGPELAEMIGAETDPATLREAMRRADTVGDDRWRIATRQRLYETAPRPQEQAELVQLLCQTRQGARAEAIRKALDPRGLSEDRRAQLAALTAMAVGDFDRSAQHIADINPDARHHFENELATTQILRGDLEGALARACALVEAKPDFGRAAVTAVRARLLRDGRAAARDQQAACAHAFTRDPDAATEAEALILLHLGRHREAGEILARALQRNPGATRLQAQAMGLVHSEIATERVRGALETCAGGPARAGDKVFSRIAILAARAEFAQARAMLEELRALSDWGYHTACVQIACQTHDVDTALQAVRNARDAGVWHGGPALSLEAFMLTRPLDHPVWAKVRPMQLALETWEHSNPGYWSQRLRYHIAHDQLAEARALMVRLPKGLREAHDLHAIALYLERDRMDNAALRRGWAGQVAESAPFAVTAPTAPPAPVALTWTGGKGDVLLFAVVQNGMEYLPWLMDYYRTLGVDHAFIVDNGSTDGGFEWLRARAESVGDVSLFSQTGSFRNAAHGVAWTNHLMQRFGVGHWCFHVDMDEAFVFPGMDEGRTLPDLLAYLDATGAESVPAFMLDIYPGTLNDQHSADPFAASDLIDTDYAFAPYELPPHTFAIGGLRARMTGQTPLMTKAPLVRMRQDLFFLSNNHFHTGARMADLSAALLHYKFVGDLRRRVDEQVARGEHFMGGRFYRSLQPHLSEETRLSSESSVRYEGPRQLLEMNYISSSEGWDRWSG